ncbi:MAG: glucoamylase family protein, partial [Bacteroidia bacterium]
PKYISTVDSGNLVGHLLVLKQGLLSLPHKKIEHTKLVQGLRDTLYVIDESLEDKELLKDTIQEMEEICSCNLTAHEIKAKINSIKERILPILENKANEYKNDTYFWKQIFIKQIESAQKGFEIFTPWILLTTVPTKFIDLVPIPTNYCLIEIVKTASQLSVVAKTHQATTNTAAENEWLEKFITALTNSISIAEKQIIAAENLAQQCDAFTDVEWDFLYDKASSLFTIGYNVQEHRADASYYDLLASEARLAAFICIAQGKLPEESWFALGRLLTNVKGNSILLSWSGSMFEYLMPLLVMPTYDNTLLDQTYKAAVKWQIDYGKQVGIPWGISESGFNMINANSNYQYRAFGAPGLGLKRGLEEDSVIAPYASALALMVAPNQACENLQALHEFGFEGRYGMYEAIDYTPSRLAPGQSNAIIYSFMSHHQGMSLLSLAYLLLDMPMQKLFEAEPQFKATLLLLQERIPKATTFYAHTTDIADINYAPSGTETRVITTPNTTIPEVQLLSNGKYHVMVTNAGSGYSKWKGLAVTRWREDVTRDNWGTFCYIKDVETEDYWSNTFQPALKKEDKYEAAFSQGRVDFRTINKEIETHTEIVVSPEDDIEMRRVRITNISDKRRTIEVTSYAEVVLAHPDSDLMQPAFSNLFVQTEIVPNQHAIICTRRPRS